MRLFIAIAFEEEVLRHFLDVQQELRTLAASGNFSRPQNLHLTLAFLGELPPSRLPAIQRVIENCQLYPLTLHFDRLGRFSRDRGDLWWIGIQKEPRLLQMQRELVQGLQKEHLLSDAGRFSPHLTLAREVVLCDAVSPGGPLKEPILAPVPGISLMQSERINGVLRYTELYYRKI